jgi:protein-disulfide isomerase
VIILIAVAAVAGAQSVPDTVGVVNGEVITAEDLGRSSSGRIRMLTESREPSQSDQSFERAKLAIRWEGLNNLIERRLTRAEAARRMISEDDLLDAEIESRVAFPSREMVEAFIEANRVRMPLIQGLSQREVMSQVGAFMLLQADRVAHAFYREKLSKQYGVRTFLEPLRADIATAGHPARGAQSPAITVVAFSDFDCADCAVVAKSLEELRKSGVPIQFVYRHFPQVQFHPRAQIAAEAATCAHRQQRFWDFHDTLFADSKDLTAAALRDLAASLNLDTAAFERCMDSGAGLRDVNKDIDDGIAAGVLIAPTVFVNGRMIFGKRTAGEIHELITDELERSRKAGN